MTKKFRSTWVMSALVLLLACYTLYDYRKAQNEGTYAADERAAFTFKGEAVDTVVITRPEESIEIHNEAGVWKMTKPVNDVVDDAGMLAFLYTVTTQRVRLFNPSGEKSQAESGGQTDWAKYGLEKPAATFELRSGKEVQSLSLSTINAFDGSYYVRQNNELFLGDNGFAQLKDRPASVFRSKLLYRPKTPILWAEVELNTDTKTQKFKVLKSDGQWTIQPKPNFPLDYAQIQAWVERLQEFKPAEISKDGIDEDDKRSFLLLKPSLKIKTDTGWEFLAGQDRAEDVFVYTNQRDTLYKVSVSGLSQIRVGVDFFRDGHKPFEFPVEKARLIEIKTPKFTHSFKKVDSGWASAQGVEEVDQDRLVDFVQALHGLEAHEFLGEVAKTGIDSNQVLVKDDQGGVIFSLAWGQGYPARKSYNNGAPMIYARTNLEKEVLGLPRQKIEQLVSPALLKKNADKAHGSKK